MQMVSLRVLLVTSSFMPRKTEKARLGRPLKGDEPLTENVTFRLTAREAQCLKDWAFRYDQQPSDVLRWALDILSITGV